MKFKKGEKVIIKDKTVGEFIGIKNMFYEGDRDCYEKYLPLYGVIETYDDSKNNSGRKDYPFYLVRVEHPVIALRFDAFMFDREDLEHEFKLEDDDFYVL